MTTKEIYDYIDELKKMREAWAYWTLSTDLKREYYREAELLSGILNWIEDQKAAEEEKEEAEETKPEMPGFEGTAEALDELCNIRR